MFVNLKNHLCRMICVGIEWICFVLAFVCVENVWLKLLLLGISRVLPQNLSCAQF